MHHMYNISSSRTGTECCRLAHEDQEGHETRESMGTLPAGNVDSSMQTIYQARKLQTTPRARVPSLTVSIEMSDTDNNKIQLALEPPMPGSESILATHAGLPGG